MPKQRLQKVLAAAGIDSRRNCEEIILEGAVRVNGKLVDTLPAFVDTENDVITVNGRKIRTAEKVHFLLNKPKGVICSNRDPQGRKKAVDLIRTDQRVFCVGRLDIDTTGLIIITNDSELANKLTHPRYSLPKTYLVCVKGRIEPEAVEKLKSGIWLAEGKTSRARVKVPKRNFKESMVEITIEQGLNRQIRRMFAKIGYPVKSLKRTQIGKLNCRGLGVGKYRRLSPSEIAHLTKVGKTSTAGQDK